MAGTPCVVVTLDAGLSPDKVLEPAGAQASPVASRCTCELAWCQVKDGIFRTSEIYRRRRFRGVVSEHVETDSDELDQRARDQIFTMLRPKSQAKLSPNTRARFRWHHFRPESFRFDEKKGDWVLKTSSIAQVKAVEFMMTPPPPGEPAVWKTSRWVLQQESATPTSTAERRLVSQVASPERKSHGRRAHSAARAAESDREHAQEQVKKKRKAENALALRRATEAEAKLQRQIREASVAESRYRKSQQTAASVSSQMLKLKHNMKAKMGSQVSAAEATFDAIILDLKADKAKLEDDKKKLEDDKKKLEADKADYKVLLSEERARAGTEKEKLEAQNKALQTELSHSNAVNADNEQVIKILSATRTEADPLRWDVFKSTARFANKIKFYTGVSSVKCFESIVSLVRVAGGDDALQRDASTAAWKAFKEGKMEPKPQNVSARMTSESASTSASCRRRAAGLRLEDRLLMTLMILRLNMSQVVIGSLFGLHQGTVSRNFEFGIQTLYTVFSLGLKTPDSEMLKASCPDKVKRKFGNHMISWLLDATELEIQVPDNPLAQSATWSEYKSRNTAKLLIGLTPSGYIGWASQAYPGRISDPVITDRSGFYAECVHPTQTIMADKGFMLLGRLARVGAQLYVPPKRFKGQKVLSQSEANDTRKIANFRIHVERAINRVKDFHWLTSKIALHQADLITPAFRVACYITALCGPPITAPRKEG